MRPVDGPVTTDFFEPRPLSKPPEERDHNHGAIDISAPIGTPIHAPEKGEVFAWCSYRIKPGQVWPNAPVINGGANSFCNYFYDTFGGVLILRSADTMRTHIITHSYGNQLFNKGIYQNAHYIEQREDDRFPIHGFYTSLTEVKEGAIIGYVGNAGYSTGAHIHWEIHHGRTWQRWESRIDPAGWG